MTGLPRLADVVAAVDGYRPDALPVAHALAVIERMCVPIDAPEPLPVANALDRVLARDVVSPIDVPAHDNTAMDGWAVRFADLDDDGRPDLSIGRLPAGDEEQAEALVEKVARQRTALRALSGRFLMVADNQGPSDAPFLLEAQAAASRLPAGSAVAWSDVASGVGEARAALARGLAEGAALTQYFGHAGEYVWADERLLGVEDVETLAAASQETVVFTWTCEAQVFNGVFGPTVNEALLLAPRGGALAAFGPSGISDPALQRELQARVNELFVRRRLPLGEAVRRAKAEALAARPEMRPVVEGFNLLGDPSLRLE